MAEKSEAKRASKTVKVGTSGAEERTPLFDAARKVLLAGIGAVALAQDEIEDFIDRLVERGEIAEKDGRKLVSEIKERRMKGATKAEEMITKRVEAILDRMNVPAKADIDALSEKIAALTKKVEELKKSQG
jgi:polyhydroxyalkanoate synthesis regulator phasin